MISSFPILNWTSYFPPHGIGSPVAETNLVPYGSNKGISHSKHLSNKFVLMMVTPDPESTKNLHVLPFIYMGTNIPDSFLLVFVLIRASFVIELSPISFSTLLSPLYKGKELPISKSTLFSTTISLSTRLPFSWAFVPLISNEVGLSLTSDDFRPLKSTSDSFHAHSQSLTFPY